MASAAVVSLLIAAVLATPASEAIGERPVVGWLSGLAPGVEEVARDFEGELSLYVLNVEDGESYAYDADTPTYLSSAIKIMVMLEVLHQVELQQLSWDELLELRPDDLRDGMHRLGSARPGERLSIATLLEYMMGDSDNAAADLLIRRVGLDRVKAQLAARGIQTGPLTSLLEERQRIYGKLDPRAREFTPAQIQALGQHASLASRARFLSGLLEHSPAWTGRELDQAFSSFYEEKVNSASMRDMGRLLAQVARCEGLSADSCSRAHQLMRGCRTGRGRIAAGLPKTAAWAHKTGTQHRRACDLGFLELRPGQTIVIAACTRGFWHVADAERLFARLGKLISTAASTPAPRHPEL
ncbi:serine hydrolase [Hyalangium minutum]|uniref:beta-lactamase n=1 Tax=Hyalangium minutum TaxID=394096 RepID=A0A085WN07_9BACT|nr:serine hydrolase [Hyalangium minutum]KFE69070.1 Beta-lactamase [Hyalangium minutum]